MRARLLSRVLAIVALAAVLAACSAGWRATILGPDGQPFAVDARVLKSQAGEDSPAGGVALDQLLAAAGHEAVERVVVVTPDGQRREIDWAAVADEAAWLRSGRLLIAGEELAVERIEIRPPALLGRVEIRITDLALRIAAALGIPAPAAAARAAPPTAPADRAVLVLLDGLGYVRYTEAARDGLVPHLAALGPPMVGLTTYPPRTNVATASLLTGARPQVHGVTTGGIRTTASETLFQAAAAAGRRVVAVEGDSLAFNLPGAEIELSGDRDGNGSTDDNVEANALAALAGEPADLLYVHLHGIDDAGHSYGPGAPEEAARIAEVDAIVGRILDAVPPGTLVVILADHGMHAVDEAGRAGNHGYLVDRDVFIPVWIWTR